MKKKRITLTGQRFGRLEVVREGTKRGYHRYWECRCDCGSDRVVYQGHLTRGRVVSCGCYSAATASVRHRTHGESKSVENRVYRNIKTRCTNPNSACFANYGARGIKMCAGWALDFESFLGDMGRRPSGATIDRIDNDGGYWCGHCAECLQSGHPANCRWASANEQARNKRSSVLTEARAAEIHSLRSSGLKYREVASRVGVSKAVVSSVLNGHSWKGVDAH